MFSLRPKLSIDTILLEEKLAQLPSEMVGTVATLRRYILLSADDALFRINPPWFAHEHQLDLETTLVLFLHAAQVGLLQMDWLLTCGWCGCVAESLPKLVDVHPQFVCNNCRAVNQTAQQAGSVLQSSVIQVTFTIAPAIRPIRHHSPMDLSIDDYIFNYQLNRDVAPPADVLRPHTLATHWIQPGKRLRLERTLAPGTLNISAFNHSIGATFVVQPTMATAKQTLAMTYQAGQLDFQNRQLAEVEVPMGDGLFQFAQHGALQSGDIMFEVTNATDRPMPLWITAFPAVSKPQRLQPRPIVTGQELLIHPVFQSLFRHARVASEEGILIRDLTFLFTDLKGSTAMYDRIGDLQAWYLVWQHFDVLQALIAQHNGTIVKTIGDAVMATFSDSADALRAALALGPAIEQLSTQLGERLTLKIGIHRGPVLAVTQNTRVDYFGQTVNIAARVQGLAGAGEVCVTRSAYHAPIAQAACNGCRAQIEMTMVKGVTEDLTVYRLQPVAARI